MPAPTTIDSCVEHALDHIDDSADKDVASTPSADTDAPPDRDRYLGAILTCSVALTFVLFQLRYTSNFSDEFLLLELPEKLAVLSSGVSWLPSQFDEAQLVVALVMGVSAFAQALTGFGFAVVSVGALSSMPWLYHSDLFEVITPVAATLGAVTGFLLLLPTARNLAWREIAPLLLPCTLLTPLGIALKSAVNPDVATRVLAVLILGFVAYEIAITYFPSSATPDDASDVDDAGDGAPQGQDDLLQSPAGAVALGSLAGICGGAFDVQGPPLVLYGTERGWSPRQFRDNILTVVALNSASVVLLDYFDEPSLLGNFYYSYFCLTSFPAVLLGVALGEAASKRIDPSIFSNVVLLMCFGLGVQLLTLS